MSTGIPDSEAAIIFSKPWLKNTGQLKMINLNRFSQGVC